MPRRDETEPVETIPLTTFLLDYLEPVDGIDLLLAQRRIPIVLDNIGRRAIRCSDARVLLAEQSSSEERGRQAQAENEAKLAAGYRPPPAGIPAAVNADGSTPAAFDVQKAADPPPKRRQSVLDHALSNEGGTVYHPIHEEQADR
jgi:hypothetical protein